jgi:hypothetical protein
MEPEVSFSPSQDTDTEPYSEPSDFSLNLRLEDTF